MGAADFPDELELLELDLFDAAFAVALNDEDEVKRRFMTLFVQVGSGRHGASAEVAKARNMRGEVFALKRLRTRGVGAFGENSVIPQTPLPASGSDVPSAFGASPSKKILRNSLYPAGSGEAESGASGVSALSVPDYVTEGHAAAFYEEYRTHMVVSHLRGFPKLYGFGVAQGDPVIVMEWVEGETLRSCVRDGDDAHAHHGLSLPVVADLGIAVLDVLLRASELDERFVHRDISPRNIMLRTDSLSAAEQLQTGGFDVCLVDFGSSSLAPSSEEAPGFTMDANIWRMGTPDYAPPEMLTADVVLPEGARQSATIDTYALASVLYELYGGEKPFDWKRQGLSPYRAKMEGLPHKLQLRPPDGGALAGLLACALSARQQDRPDVAQMRAALENWKAMPQQRSIGRLHGARPSGGRMWQSGYARTVVTRRRFVAAGVVGAAAIVAGVLVAGKPASRTELVDAGRYVKAQAAYDGEPLYKALDSEHEGWMLCADDGSVRCRPKTSREIGQLREGLISVLDDASGLYGYMTPDDSPEGCSWFLLPQYAAASDFSEGFAAAQDAETKLWGYVDGEGNWTVPARYGAASAFSRGAASVRVADGGRQWGCIDAAGQWLIEPRFAALGSRSDNGHAVAQGDDGRWGIVDERGSWACEPRFAQLRRFAFGMAPALDDEGVWGFVNSAGNWVVQPAFRDARPFCAQGDVPVAAVQDERSQLWYFVDADGSAREGMPPRFWKLGDLHDGLAPAQATPEDDSVAFGADDAGEVDDAGSYVQYAGMRYGYVDAVGNWHLKPLVTLVDTSISPAGI